MNTGCYPCFLGSASHSFTSTTHNHPPQPSIDLVNSLDKKCWHITSQGCVVRSAHLAEGQSSSGVLWSAEQVMLLQVCPGCDRGCSYYLLCRLTTASRTQWIITGHLRSVSTDSSLPGVSLIQSCQYRPAVFLMCENSFQFCLGKYEVCEHSWSLWSTIAPWSVSLIQSTVQSPISHQGRVWQRNSSLGCTQ